MPSQQKQTKNELRPAAWANQLIGIWRSHRPQVEINEYPISVSHLIEGYINQRYPTERIAIHALNLDSIEGVLLKTESGWTIGYNQNIDHAGRVNFTLAHELGHYLCHRALQDSFNCGQQQMMDTGYGKDTIDIEREANEFAAQLLMPYDDFRKETEGKNVTVEVISDCAGKYAVSWTAAVFQWLNFTSLKAVFIQSRDGYVIRTRRSDAAFKAGFGVQYAQELPAESVTRKCEKDGNSEEARNGILQPKGIWHPDYEVLESAMFSRKFKDWSYTILLYK